MKITYGTAEEPKDEIVLKTERRRMSIQFRAALGFSVQERK